MVSHMQKERTGGFSLVEIMIVIAIMGIVMAVAAPSIQSMMANQRMSAAGSELVISVMHARSEAVKYGGFTDGVTLKAPSDDFSQGWCVVIASASACSVTSPGGDVMRISPPPTDVSFQWVNPTTATALTFNQSGRLKSPSVSSSIRIQLNNTVSSGAGLSRCVTIDPGGSARASRGAC